MAKIKLYIAKAQSNNSGAAKGTAENPYTEAEYEAMLNNGTWPGGYVQNLGYCVKEGVISSSYPNSRSMRKQKCLFVLLLFLLYVPKA